MRIEARTAGAGKDYLVEEAPPGWWETLLSAAALGKPSGYAHFQGWVFSQPVLT